MLIDQNEGPVLPESTADDITPMSALRNRKNVEVIDIFTKSLRCLVCGKRNNAEVFGGGLVDVLTTAIKEEYALHDNNRAALLRHQMNLSDFRIRMEAEYDAMIASCEADLRQYFVSIREVTKTKSCTK